MKNNDLILSPSAINLFIEEPALWVLKHFYKVTGGFNIYAVRGKVAEEVVNMVQEGDIDSISFERFLPRAVEKTLFDEVDISLEDYKEFYKWGCKCIDPVLGGRLILSTQDKIEGEMFGIKLAGYTDYLVEDGEGEYYLDLKTANKVPHILTRGARAGQLPAFKAANVRQQVVYSYLSGKNTRLLFINGEGETLEYAIQQQDIDEQMPIIEDTIKKIKEYLTMDLKDVIIDSSPKNIGSFYWDETTREKAEQIWGI